MFLSSSVPNASIPIETVLSAEELNRRPSRPPDYQAENKALTTLAQELADSPTSVLQRLVDITLVLCRAHSAGVSLLEEPGPPGRVSPIGDHFRWHAVAGKWSSMVWNTTTPREHSPCGTVLDRNATLLFNNPHRYYPQLLDFRPLLIEGLLVPFYMNGQAVGTIWAVAHDDSRRFDAEDQRLLESLGAFAAMAYQARSLISTLEKLNQFLAEERQQSEERFARFMRHLPGLAWIKDSEGRYVYANDHVLARWRNIGGLDILGMTDEEFIPPVMATRIRERDRRVLTTRTAELFVEPFEEKDGSQTHWLVTKFPIGTPNGAPPLVGGMAIDISEQTQAERVLREQAELLDLATDAILIHKPTGELTYWNHGAEQLYGWSQEEALGRKVHLLLRTGFPRPVEEIVAEVATVGHWEGDLIHTRQDGSVITVASRWNRRLGKDRKLSAILEINTNVTELRRAAKMREQFLGQLIATQEEERKRVSRELHDGIAQNLSALQMRASALAASATIPGPVRPELRELQQLAQSAAEEVRFLARGLRPPALDKLGLLPALTRYAADLERIYRITVEVTATGCWDDRLSSEMETAIYRIAQEALTNVARHSGANTVTVVLLRQPSFVQLLVEDNGAGFDSRVELVDAYTHLGLDSMKERAALVGGTISFEAAPGGGTTVCVRIPVRRKS